MRRSTTAERPVDAPLQLEIWVGDVVPERLPRPLPQPDHPATVRGSRLLVGLLGVLIGAALGIPAAAVLGTAPRPAAAAPPPGATLLVERLDDEAAADVHEGSGPWVLRPSDEGGVAVIELGLDEWVVVRRQAPEAAPVVPATETPVQRALRCAAAVPPSGAPCPW
ncbi:hypothetical protein [Isoptericola variabilis]|uniref:Uncharacterized protein n=1 Tax=Isoptericola variabilis (strain 225) TaxID=743718 RepID=F6FPG1_ISOV2|nr:hypothetical protein [Isoptericola variabilis]AEG43674.1 hypothetical protein Isova_0890 [Isoptericola variabilis 225]TWH27355.1 hypothetical protein L600_000500000280 [Isoptericola variabilis J7]